MQASGHAEQEGTGVTGLFEGHEVALTRPQSATDALATDGTVTWSVAEAVIWIGSCAEVAAATFVRSVEPVGNGSATVALNVRRTSPPPLRRHPGIPVRKFGGGSDANDVAVPLPQVMSTSSTERYSSPALYPPVTLRRMVVVALMYGDRFQGPALLGVPP